MEQYKADLAAYKQSGAYEINDEQRALNLEVRTTADEIFPIDDIHKHSDMDLIFRFLIAKKWAVAEAIQGLKDYVEFRQKHNLNNILWETLPQEVEPMYPTYGGFDRFGNPVSYDRPDLKTLTALLKDQPRELLIRAHLAAMERGRRIAKAYGADRICLVFDLSLVYVSVLTNTAATGLLKEISHIDQTYFPENIRTTVICNGGWTFSGIWKLMKLWLDERAQKKTQVMATGKGMPADIDKWIDLKYISTTLGGRCGEAVPFPVADVASLPPATPPSSASRVDYDLLLVPGSPQALATPPTEEAAPEAM